MIHLNIAERIINLCGAIEGDLSGSVGGSLTESVAESDVYDMYGAVWQLTRLKGNPVVASINVSGTMSFMGSTPYASTGLYTFQSSFAGTASGFYTGVFNPIITHVRVNDATDPYDGEGFSIISNISTNGAGNAWTYDKVISTDMLEMNGFSTLPLLGSLCGILNSSGASASLLVTIERTDYALPPMADLEIKIWGPHNLSPGQTMDYIIEYGNFGSIPAENIIIVQHLPDEVDYVTSSDGGIYIFEAHQILWKLGTIAPGSKGYLSSKVTVDWGLPGHLQFSSFLTIDTTSAEVDSYLDPELKLDNFDEYLNYETIKIITTKNLSISELSEEFAINGELQDLFDFAIDQGYVYSNITIKYIYNDATFSLNSIMFPPDASSSSITSSSDEFHINELYTLQRGDGSPIRMILIDLKYDGTYYSLTFRDAEGWCSYRKLKGVKDLTPVGSAGWKSTDCNRANLVWNCLREKWNSLSDIGAEFSGDIIDKVNGNLGSVYNTLTTSEDCLACISGDTSACDACFLDIFYDEDMLDGLIPPGGFTILECIGEAGKHPEKYECKPGEIMAEFCASPTTIGWMECDADCAWKAKYTPCPKLSGCISFRNKRAMCYKTIFGVKRFKNLSDIKHEILTASDPNIKHGKSGYILPGEKLDYKIEFENVGEGIAFGVYFVDTLNDYLDESTLVLGPVKSKSDDSIIGPVGTYDPATRTITWLAGEVGPLAGGYTELSVNVKSDAPSGTEIINYATIYFPSVPQITLTNGIVSIVSTKLSFNLCSGLNLVALNFNNIKTEKADTLLADLCAGNADVIWKYDCNTKNFYNWTIYDSEVGWECPPGMAFWVNIPYPGGCTWESSGALDISISYNLCAGLNLVALPIYSTGITKASELRASVPNCTAVYRFKKETDCINPLGFDAYFDISDPGDDFDLIPGYGYWVNVTVAGIWTPPNP
ncbi:MAG: hypothetical protein A2161_20485 [Candidatus Schekmanbacteria bacterium RBG_13_48_7]|uniref:Uncharacterized protein n=1 Tax=Candidatus Schekmanbacteria bacterium RBG_13_48_7 TaxID=1817878 RepID=A0A1F7RKB7_9BACT|nr:MAG: hypothetical protein A2161_20485 [Candidatus Schekmanbacteria bacterium RBG_13_48_7]